MKHLILIAMPIAIATAAAGQGRTAMTPTDNWLAAHQAAIGTTVPAQWLQDIGVADMEVLMAEDRTLVLVDRAPVVTENGTAFMRRGLHGLGGTRLALVEEVEHISEDVLRGTYRGSIGGAAVQMDQYVRLRNGVPVTVVRMVRRTDGSAPPARPIGDHLVLELIDAPADAAPTMVKG